jgi:mRNA interferase MazF
VGESSQSGGFRPGLPQASSSNSIRCFQSKQIQTVVVVAITSNLELSGAPGNVTVTPRSTGLPKDSVINVSQVLTIDRALLGEYAGTIPVRKMNQVDHGLRLALSL